MCLWFLIVWLLTKLSDASPGDRSQQKCDEYYNVANFTSDDGMYAFFGGLDAKPKELPFMAALGYADGNTKTYLCGGSLVSEKFVVTAAHCIFSRIWGPIRYIRLGTLNISSAVNDINAQEFELKQYHVHPGYRYPTRYHDIALIELDGLAKFSDYVKPVCINSWIVDLEYYDFYAAGWGALGYGQKSSEHLQIGQLKYYSLKECQNTFQKDTSLPDGVVDKYQLCAGAIDTLADTCEGDSGGPLVYSSFNVVKRFFLAGITSFGKACALGKIPAVYTRVSNYVDWIEKIVWPEEKPENPSDKIIFPDYK